MNMWEPPADPRDTPYLKSRIFGPRLAYLTKKCEETLQANPGNVLEVGVYKGGSLIKLARLIRAICPTYTVYGVDTFEGHLYSDGHPKHPVGKYNDVRFRVLQKEIHNAGLSRWIKLYKGPVEEVFSTIKLGKIVFAHIDCDLYIPTKYCAATLPKLMTGRTRIFFDDFGSSDCPGATRAVEEELPNYTIHKARIGNNPYYYSYYIDL